MAQTKKNAVSVSLSGEISDDLAEIFADAYQAAGITLGRARNVAVAPTNAREHAAAYANQRGGELITDIDDTTHEAVQRVVSGALKRGESDTDVKEKLSNIFGDQRAEMIARTEMQTAYNLGVVKALKDAGEEYVYVDDGDEFDEECQNADGEYWTIEEAEANPLEHPNCQRTFRPLSDDELAEVMAEEEADSEEGFSAKDAARFSERLERALFFSEDQPRDEKGQWFYSENQPRDEAGRFTDGGGGDLIRAENKIANLTPQQQAHQRALKAARSRAFKQRQAAIKAGLPVPPKPPAPPPPPVAPKTPPVATTPPQAPPTAPPAPTAAGPVTPPTEAPRTGNGTTLAQPPPGMQWTPQGWVKTTPGGGEVVVRQGKEVPLYATPVGMDPLHSYEGPKPAEHLGEFGIKVNGATDKVREGWTAKGQMKNAIQEGLRAVAKLPAQHLDGIRSVNFVKGFGRRRANGTYQGFGAHISLLNARTIQQMTGPGEAKWYSARGTAIHEVGHHVHMSKLTDDAAREWAMLSRGDSRYGGGSAKISDYARTDYTEHFAEAYRAYHLGGEHVDRLKALEPRVHAFMVKVHEPRSSYLLPRGSTSEYRSRASRGGNKSGKGY